MHPLNAKCISIIIRFVAHRELLLGHHTHSRLHHSHSHSRLHHAWLHHAWLHHHWLLLHRWLVGEVASVATLAPINRGSPSSARGQGPWLQLLFDVVCTTSLDGLFGRTPLVFSSGNMDRRKEEGKGRGERRDERERENHNHIIYGNAKTYFFAIPPLEPLISIPKVNG